MAVHRFPCQGKGMAKDKDRLAEALRENLKRRKAQARALDQGVIPAQGPHQSTTLMGPKAGTPGREDADEGGGR